MIGLKKLCAGMLEENTKGLPEGEDGIAAGRPYTYP